MRLPFVHEVSNLLYMRLQCIEKFLW